MKPEQIAKESESSHQVALLSIGQARLFKHKTYQGSACRKCGLDEKYTSSSNCVKCVAQRVKDSKDKSNKARNEKYITNKQYIRERDKKWRDSNKDKIEIYTNRHRSRRNELTIQWRKDNPEKQRAISARSRNNRRARKQNAEGNITLANIDWMYIIQKAECFYCHTSISDRFDIEHKMPLSRGGSNYPENIVLSCRVCNAQKNNKTILEWFATLSCRATKR